MSVPTFGRCRLAASRSRPQHGRIHGRKTLVELLTVAHRYEVQGRGVVVVTPNLLPPPHGWRPSSHTVAILTPDGRSRQAEARLELWHFNIPDPKLAAEHGSALVLSLPAMEDVPIGSRIMVPASLRDALRPPS